MAICEAFGHTCEADFCASSESPFHGLQSFWIEELGVGYGGKSPDQELRDLGSISRFATNSLNLNFLSCPYFLSVRSRN